MPLLTLSQIVARLAKVYGKTIDDDLLAAYFDGCGHRSLEDLNVAYKTIVRDDNQKFMPTPGQLRAACGYIKG